MFDADFLHGPSKSVEVAPNLPPSFEGYMKMSGSSIEANCAKSPTFQMKRVRVLHMLLSYLNGKNGLYVRKPVIFNHQSVALPLSHFLLSISFCASPS
jgi:hypothetical protein